MKNFFPDCFFYILLICLISQTLSDNQKVLKSIELEQKIKGKMDENDSREYYELKLQKNIPKDSLLVFTVKESRKGVKEGEELFSDPDIYVSKSTKYPSNREEAEWYSERYGNDILTIPSYAVEKDETFYICMYCQYKCRYELYSYLAREAPAELGKYYSLTLTKKSSISYALYIPQNEKKEELNVITNNPTLKNFRVFMAKNSPSSQNTFQVIPSWTGGYVISISRYNKDYCTDCTYHLLFQTEEEKVNIQFIAYFQSTLTKITSGNPINDAVKAGSKRCYYFDTSNTDNLYNSKLVINANLYSGSLLLYISGWKENLDEKNFKAKDHPYSYHVENDKMILLQKEDFENFDKSNNVENGEGKKLYFCAYGQQMSSYLINIYFLSEAQALQRFNFISPGSELTGYLQGGQVTKYTILDYNLNKNSIITLSFNSLEGKVEFFSTFCRQNCYYNDEKLKQGLQNGEITLSNDVSFQKKNIIIKPEDNTCYKENIRNSAYLCKTLVIVKCFGNKDDICSFKILPSINDQSIFMSPKKTYYNIIAKGKTDLYEILINDEEVNSMVIVLTSVTGDAELQVEKIEDKIGKSNFHGKLSRNKDYIPDVVRVTPALLGSKNIVGKYMVKITSVSFSSYNLYYYTTRIKAKEEQPDVKDITLSLNEGNIIKDYFPNDLSFKIFSYVPLKKQKEDIKIVLTRINVHFSFKVYLDFSKIKYNYDVQNKYQERLENYLWASDHNNELTISKNDKNYSKKGPYYIVVTRDNIYQDDENEELETNSLMMYYLGVTKRGVPFTLNEGIENSETLSEQYDYQDYFYIHKDIKNPFNLEVNVLNGEVDVFVDTKELKKENITAIYNYLEKNTNENENNIRNSLYMRLGINSYASIELFRGYFEQNCMRKQTTEFEDKSCSLYIYVVQSKNSRKYHRDSQYIINAKSSINTATLLLSGQVYNAKSKENLTDHYIIEEVKHLKGTTIYVQFKKGNGNVYLRIPKVPETGNNITFPDAGHCDFRGSDTYNGKIITIPPKIFDRIDSNSLKLQMLISVFPIGEGGDSPFVEYSITYGSEPKRISQNVPYQSFLNAGEHHYFTFYFDESTENIYISLSNMNGDADMYLNYGNENLPSINKYDFYSNNLGHEYIDINIKSEFFKKNKKKSIAGYYTLLVIGYTETTYTLYVSSHPDKIFPLFDNSPVSCQCQIKGKKCLFRYNGVFNSGYKDQFKEIEKTEIIFTTQYIYGNGRMYASVYKDQELTDDPNKKYQDYFPSEQKYQFSNSETGKRNYLKVDINKQYFTKDSLVLLTYICDEKTDVEITAAALQHSQLYAYIDPDRENMFYLKYNESLPFEKQQESVINFYSNEEENLIYEIHAYKGKARIKIFTNETIFNDKYEIVGNDYNHIAEFNIRAEYDDLYSNIKTYTENYFNSINSKLIHKKNIYFNVKPMSDFGFYIQVTYDKKWISLPIGETKSYLINNNYMAGYFDIHEEFSNIEMSLNIEEFTQKRAYIYVKVLVLSKDATKINSVNGEDKLYHYEIPSNINYDYKGRTDSVLGVANININNLPILKENEKDKKFIRAVFSVEVIKKRSNRRFNENTQTINQNTNPIISPQTKVSIGVVGAIDNFKRIDLPQRVYYFSNTSLIPNSLSNYQYNSYEYKQSDGNKEVKMFSLGKRSNSDKKMVIQVHSCSGKFEYKLTNKIIDYNNNPNNIALTNDTDEYGRSRFLIDDLKNSNLYLSIKSAQNPQDCNVGKEKDSKGIECSKELSYLIYYYSLSPQEFTSKKYDLMLKYRYVPGKHWQVRIVINPLEGKDRFNNRREQNEIEYNLIWTRNSTLKERLNNTCYLSQILNKNEETNFNASSSEDEIFIIRNIFIDEKNEYTIDNLGANEIIYVNVLARNLRTNELIAYIPLAGITDKPTFRFLKLILSFIIIGGLVMIVYLLFKYIKKHKLDGYEDLRHPRISTEMGTIRSNQGGYQRIQLPTSL